MPSASSTSAVAGQYTRNNYRQIGTDIYNSFTLAFTDDELWNVKSHTDVTFFVAGCSS